MPTLLFDFDSTLINCESLEEIASEYLDDQTRKDISVITKAGMEGQISFAESLAFRLKLAQPNKSAIEKFTANPKKYLTQGMPELIKALQAQNNYDIWIISGGLAEVIYPFAAYLNIPKERVRGITGRWYGDNFHFNQKDLFSQGKIQGCEALSPAWTGPKIAIGDGMTDFALYQEGLVDHFLPYTEHVSRDFIKNNNLTPIRNTTDLKQALDVLLA